MITFAAGQRMLGYVMVGVSVAELVAVELLVPWPRVRLVLLVVGLVSLVWVVWFLRALQRRVHEVVGEDLVLRGQVRGEVHVPLRLVAGVTTGLRAEDADGVTLDGPGEDGAVLRVAVSSSTNVDLALREPVVLRSDRVAALAGGPRVGAVRFWADDPAEARRIVEDAVRGLRS